METDQALPYSFTCINSGVDWITATARLDASRSTFEDIWQGISRKETAAGVEMKPAAVRDYSGWRLPGIFYGERHDDSIITLSGAGAPAHWQTVARAADNVSRLDLQATVWTHGEQPQLARWYHQRLRRAPPKRGRPRKVRLEWELPYGETLYVNKRTSDAFGRVYDYATAHKAGTARTLWRYEVEYKRHPAASYANSLLDERVHPGAIESIVANWFDARGVRSTWLVNDSLRPAMVLGGEIERDVLSWFESSMSKTVAKAIRRYGVAAVLDSLHLSQYVIVKPEEEDSPYAN